VIKTTNGGTSWAKVINGLGRSEIQALAVDPSNSSILYAGGAGNDTPEAFITKLNASGSGLLFSTFLGGSGDDSGQSIALDSAGNIYVVGQHQLSEFSCGKTRFSLRRAQPKTALTHSSPRSTRCSVLCLLDVPGRQQLRSATSVASIARLIVYVHGSYDVD
jgi:hypothetical protein